MAGQDERGGATGDAAASIDVALADDAFVAVTHAFDTILIVAAFGRQLPKDLKVPRRPRGAEADWPKVNRLADGEFMVLHEGLSADVSFELDRPELM
jgi:hypothetical protein